MRNLLKQSLGVVVVLTAVACGSNDDAGTSEASEGAAASGATTGSAGKTASSAGGSGATRTGAAGTTATGASGTKATTAAGAGTSATTSGAGNGGSAGKGAAAADDDAGVPPAAGSSGSAGHAGNAAHAGSGGAGGGSAGSSGSMSAAGSGGSSAAAATFTQVYALINTGCSGVACHVGASVAGGMLAMPDKATAYKNLVGVDAAECRGEKRVVAGDPAKSELVASLKHTQVGSCTRTPQMPENKAQWKDSDIALVESWIQAGAKDD